MRPAGPEDAAALAALATRLRSAARARRRSPRARGPYLQTGRSPAYFRRVLGERTILVAVAEAQLVGYAQFGPVTLREVRPDTSNRALNRLHVATSLEGRGIGRRLMHAALSHPELAGAPRIFVRVSEQNERALALYAHLGFRRAAAGYFTTGAAPPGDLVMVLDRREAAG